MLNWGVVYGPDAFLGLYISVWCRCNMVVIVLSGFFQFKHLVQLKDETV